MFWFLWGAAALLMGGAALHQTSPTKEQVDYLTERVRQAQELEKKERDAAQRLETLKALCEDAQKQGHPVVICPIGSSIVEGAVSAMNDKGVMIALKSLAREFVRWEKIDMVYVVAP